MSSKTQQKSTIIKITLDSSSTRPTSSDSLQLSINLNQKNDEQPKESNSSNTKTIDKGQCLYAIDHDKPNSPKPPFKGSIKEEKTHAHKRRWFVLLIFCCFSAINSFQWIQYSIITRVIAYYYGVSNQQVNLTSMVYMITYILFIIPANLMLNRLGLRRAIFLGTLCTALGSFIKWQLGGEPCPTSFWWMMAGQTIVALSQLYILSIPPLLAAVWFPDNQVSTATRIGVLGNQLGIALGSIIPPKLIRDPEGSSRMICEDLNLLSASIFWISLAICLISELTMEDKPPRPPNSASYHAAHQEGSTKSKPTESVQMGRNDNSHKTQTLNSIKQLWRDDNFMCFVMSYGVHVGCFYAISTVLNQIVFARWPNQILFDGTLGLFVVYGMVCSVLCYHALELTPGYKLLIVNAFLLSILSMAIFFAELYMPGSKEFGSSYVGPVVLGFYMTGYLSLGLQFAAEITSPQPANMPAALLHSSAQLFGLILTLASSLIVNERGDSCANSYLTSCFAMALVLTIIMKVDLKERRAVE